MSRRAFATLFLCAGGFLLLLFTPSGRTLSQSIQSVLVTNFPDVQQIQGEVNVQGVIRLSEMVTFKELIVPPVLSTDTTRLVEAGTLVTDGFPNVVLSLHGVVRGDVKRTGDVGVILIPDVTTVQEAFNEQGKTHFALEAIASGVSNATPFFASNQPRYTIGFQSYRVLLYNSTDKTVTANLYAYLTN
jgi:hypothetical protein